MDPELIKKLLPVLATHLVAFIIFIGLLKVFALGPVLKVLDERRKRIADEIDAAEKKRKQAESLAEDYEAKIREIDEEAHNRMQEEVARGKRIAEELSEKARAEASDIIDGARSNVQIQLEQAREQIKEEVVAMTLAATEKLLHENLDNDKQRDLVHRFIGELAEKN